MKNTVKYLAIAFLAGIFCMACDEFPPVHYSEPDPEKIYTDADFPISDFMTIADLKALYTNTPVDILTDVYIKGQVISSDEDGNLYRTMYIQDETGGIEIKMGTRNLYNEYKMGQWIYVWCKGLSIGNYGGMVQLGYKADESSSYDTAYIDVQYIIDTHIFKGVKGTIEPIEISASDITDSRYIGSYVTVPNMQYSNQVFVILYDDNDNSLYLSGTNTYGLTTWSITEVGFSRYMQDGFGGAIAEEDRSSYSPSAYNLSQYFNPVGDTRTYLQIRTSGYARFADYQIDQRILDGATVNLTGILTKYNSNNQFLLNTDSDVV
ncbi:MAG: DUF5689 domain-containing protein, partial [Bacteroidales bacterium]|nr:DUF5689 domain-containing protein [Bacteroidales bacterium]